MKQLSPLDSNFFYFETPNQPMIIGSLWLCDQSSAPNGIVRYQDILQYVEDRLSTTSIFRRRLQHVPFRLDDPYWLEDENFELEYHVRHVSLPQPGDWHQLRLFTARTMSRTLDMERAPWEIYIIDGVNNIEGVPPNSFAVLVRFHHAYVDGKSSLELSTTLMEDTPNHEYGRRDHTQYVERAPTLSEMWLRTMPRLFGQSLRGMRAGMEVTLKSMELLNRLYRDARPEQLTVPKTIFNAPVTRHRVYDGYTWTLAELKRMRALCAGATVNDVIVAIIAGGMRRYLLQRSCLPERASLIAMCPVALRPDDSRHEGGNRISAMYIPIGTDIADPVQRLAAVQRRTSQGVPLAKEVLCDLGDAAGEMLPAYVRALLAWANSKTRLLSRVPLINTVITNVPGIPGLQPKYFAGAKISSVFPLVPVSDGVAITHGITGIYDNISLGILADRQVVPDIDLYIRCIADSTQEYRQLTERRDAAARAVPKETASAGTEGTRSRRSRSGRTATRTAAKQSAKERVADTAGASEEAAA